jgi:hypothetical protein
MRHRLEGDLPTGYCQDHSTLANRTVDFVARGSGYVHNLGRLRWLERRRTTKFSLADFLPVAQS